MVNQDLGYVDGMRGWVIFDEGVRSTYGMSEPFPNFVALDRYRFAVDAGARHVEASTLVALADGLAEHGVDRAGLLATFAGDTTRSMHAGHATRAPLPTAAQLRELARAPYYALEVQPSITFTMGGIAIDPAARVLDAAGSPIDGLFAAGCDIGGLSSSAMPAGSHPRTSPARSRGGAPPHWSGGPHEGRIPRGVPLARPLLHAGTHRRAGRAARRRRRCARALGRGGRGLVGDGGVPGLPPPDRARTAGPRLRLRRHSEMAAEARFLIESGVPFAIEKPGGITLAEVRANAALARERHAFAAVPFTMRMTPFRRLIAELSPGTELSYGLFRQIPGTVDRYRDWGAGWHLELAESGGGAALNLGIHFYDLVHDLAPSADWDVAGAVIGRRFAEAEIDDLGMVLLRGGDAIASIETGYLPNSPREFIVEAVVGADHYRWTADDRRVVARLGDGRVVAVGRWTRSGRLLSGLRPGHDPSCARGRTARDRARRARPRAAPRRARVSAVGRHPLPRLTASCDAGLATVRRPPGRPRPVRAPGPDRGSGR